MREKKDGSLIKETIKKVIEDLEKKTDGINGQIKNAWEKTVKEKLLKETQILGFKEGILKVKVNNSSCYYRLTFLKKSIIKKINNDIEEGKKIKKIKFIL